MKYIKPNSKRWLSLEDLPSERWVDIKEYEGLYKISDYGRVKSLKRPWVVKDIIIKVSYDKDGYVQVHLSKYNTQVTQKVHRLVAQTFIPNPDNLPQVNHKNEFEKDNNHISNLEWCTNEYNQKYGTHFIRSQNAHCKPIFQYDDFGNLIKKHRSMSDIHKELGYSKTSLIYAIKNKQGRYKGYIWKYAKEENNE